MHLPTWTTSRIGACCTVGDGAHASIKRQESGVMYLTSKNFKPDGLDLSKVDFIAQEDFERHFRARSKALTMPKAGDVLVGIIGTLGEPYVVQPSDRFGLSSSVAIIRPDQSAILPDYLYYWMRGDKFQSAVYGTKGGVAQSYLSLEMIRSLPLEFPCLPIQDRIVSILSAYDDLIENNTRRIKILEEMAQMVYREWFVNFRFPGHEKVRMVASELGLIPNTWRVGCLQEALVLQRGFDLPTAQRVPGDVPIIAATGLNGFHNESRVKGPGVVTGRSGSLGTVIFVWENFWPLNTALWVKEFRQSTPVHAYFTLKSLDLHSFNSGAAVPTLNRNDIHGLPTVLPERETLNAFDEYVLPLFALKGNLEVRNTNLRNTRDLLLPKLISGEISVEAIADAMEQPA